jgi:hypothetical protein
MQPRLHPPCSQRAVRPPALALAATPARPTPDVVRITESPLQGKTMTGIAREAGISRQFAARVANSPDVRRILDEVIAAKRERVATTLDAVLDAI